MDLAKRWEALALASFVGIASTAFAAAPVVDTSHWPEFQSLPWTSELQPVTPIAGYDYRYPMYATNNPTSYDAQGLPSGLSVDPSTGIISGTLPAAGSYPVTLSASNADGTGSANVTLTVQPAPTAAPVIQSIADRDTFMEALGQVPAMNPGDYYDYYSHTVPDVYVPITASNYPSTVTATGLPDTARIVGPQLWYIDYNPNALTPGRYRVAVTASNPAGSSTTDFNWTVHPALLTLKPDKLGYATGQTITFTATFDAPVVVTGAPYVPVNHGTDKAFYVSGTGSTTLVFQYTFTPADGSFQEDTSDSIQLNGGAIATTDGISAKVALSPQVRIWYPPHYFVNPCGEADIVSVTPPPSGTYGLGSVLEFKVNYSHAVVATGTPGLDLKIGSSPSSAVYVAGSGTSTLVFDYKPVAGDNGPVTLTGIVGNTGGGTIMDVYGEPVAGSYPAQTLAGVQVATNSTAPGTTSMTMDVTPPSTAAQNGVWQFTGTAPPGSTVYVNFISGPSDALPGNFAGVTAAADGSWSKTITIDTQVGTFTWSAYATDAKGTEIAGAHYVSFDIPGTLPTLSSVEVDGVVGTPITPVQIPSTGAPYLYQESLLGNYGLSISTSGVISGTPTQTGGPIAVLVQARSATGWSKNATITLTITDGKTPSAYTTIDSVTPPPTGTGQAAPWVFTGTAPANAVVTVYGYALPGALPGPVTTVTASSTGQWTATRSLITTPGTYVFGASAKGAPADKRTSVVITDPTQPSSTPPPPAPTPPPTIPPPVSPPSTQTVVFMEGSVPPIVGQPYALAAAASSGLPVTFSIVSGHATLDGNSITLLDANPVIVRATQSGNASYSAAFTDATFVANKTPQQLDFVSPTSSIIVGTPVKLGATTTSGLPITYQVVSGPASIDGDMLTVTGTGPVVVRATQAGSDTVASTSVTMTVNGQLPPLSRLVNLSARAVVNDSDAGQSFIVGFVVSGSSPKPMLLRAVGPGLAALGVQHPVANPRLTLYDGSGRVVLTNDDWAGPDIAAASLSVGAFALNAGSTDAAALATLPPGQYTVQVTANGGSGIALAEIYDASGAGASDNLVNSSARAYVGAGESAPIVGFVVNGNAPKRMLIRAVGPGLVPLGVSTAIADPQLSVVSNGQIVAQNDDWEAPQSVSGGGSPASGADIAAAEKTVGAFALQSGSHDAAVVATLAPGAYTVVVTGAGNSAGIALAEVYELPASP